MDKVLLSIFIATSGLCAVCAHVGRQYHFVYELKTMTEALSYCREKYTDLATVESLDDVTLLNNMANTSQMELMGHKYGTWIGLYDDINSWRWSLSDESFYKPGENELRNWHSGEPNNQAGVEHCLCMYDTGKWNDLTCGIQLQPICCDVTGSNVTFVLIPTSMSWTEAQSYCRRYHTDLASVRNMSENQKIKELVPAGQRVWIGLSRESWEWTDGSNSSFGYWNKGTKQPDNHHKNETCAVANFGANGQWEDWPCNWKWSFICYEDLAAEEKQQRQKAPVFQQVIRVRMVTQNPSLNLNNPAVMEDLLKQIKQKLKDQGVNENIKLSWRKQADGKVFHEEKEKKTKREKKDEC